MTYLRMEVMEEKTNEKVWKFVLTLLVVMKYKNDNGKEV